jgi:hypothetical protein
MKQVADILGEVKSRFGISFSETMTGGGCCALEARLESGHWIVATDEALCGFRERIEFESRGDNYNSHYSADHCAMGWSIGIYPDMGGEEGWFGADSIVDVVDIDARAEKLPDMVELALAELTGVAKRNAPKKGMQ